MNNLKDMGKIIAEKRKKAGMTQEAFAAKLGITPQAVSKWENGVGYPDITLLPEIAKALNVSIDEMFAEKIRKTIRFPDFYEGLKFIFAKGNRAVYSSKEVESADEKGSVKFKDGSTADIDEGYAENYGAGEIKFFESDDSFYEQINDAPSEIDEELEVFNSVFINLGLPAIAKIIKAEDRKGRITVAGTKRFMSKLNYKVTNEKFSLSVNNHHGSYNGSADENHITVYVPFDLGKSLEAEVNGSGEITVIPDFEKSNVRINGSGYVSAASTKYLEATINGSGEIKCNKAEDYAKFLINGSGDIEVNETGNTDLAINGSGEMKIDLVNGDTSVRIAGSGDIILGGTSNIFKCRLTGSGDVDANRLTVNDAEIYVDGSGSVRIGRIINSSKEKISKGADLTVNRRG